MNPKNLFPLAMAASLIAACTPQEKTIDKQSVIHRLSLEDKAHFVIGTGMAGMSGNNAVIGATKALVPGAAGTTYPLDSLGIPAIVLADGPAGLRIDAHRQGDSATYFCTHFPIGTLLASTWNQALVEQVGKAMGSEVKEYGVDVLLAPAVNIHRNPLNGRNFEYYSEDPLVPERRQPAYIRAYRATE
jgi:beta-glucosidase